MKSDDKTRILMTALIVLYLVVSFLFYTKAWFSFIETNGVIIHDKYHWYVVILYIVLLAFLLRIYAAFRVSYVKPKLLIFSQTVANLVAITLVYALVSIVWGRFFFPTAFITLLFVQILFNIAWSYLADALWFRFHAPLKTTIIYENEADLERIDAIYCFTRKFSILKTFCVRGHTLEELIGALDGVEALFVVGVKEEWRNALMLTALEKSIEGFFQPQIHDIVQSGARQIHSFGTPLMGVSVTAPDPIYMVVKRLIAFLMALMLIIVLSPVMLIAAIAIRVTDPTGPVIFTQQRMGRGMKPFTCYKFRTMSTAAPPDCHPRDFDAKSFLTPLGSFLRETSIDELPQLFNILKGDMCFIGPRPIQLTEKELIAHREILGIYQLYPGISGLAQVSGRNAVNDTEKLFFDYEYLLKISILLDIKIFFSTVLFVLMHEGVYVKKGKS